MPAWLGVPDRLLGYVLMAFNAAGTCIILVLTLMTDAEVISRKLADIPGLNDLVLNLQRPANGGAFDERDAFLFGPIEGVLELGELAIVAIVFLQLGYATRAGKMVRSDGLRMIAHKRWPVLGHVLGAIFNLLAAAFFAVIIMGGHSIFMQHFNLGLWVGTQGVFAAPTWPTKLIVLAGCVGVALQLVIFAIKHVLAIGNPAIEPEG